MKKKFFRTNIALLTILSVLWLYCYPLMTAASDNLMLNGSTTVTGQITEPDGLTTVDYAYIVIHDEEWNYYISAASDEYGNFTFSNVTAGTYIFELYAYDSEYPDPPATNITVPSSGTLNLGIIKLKTPNLVGQVTKSDGTTPVSYASINVYNSDYSIYRWTNTNAEGNFNLYLPSSGTYTLDVWANDENEANPAPVTFSYTLGTTKSFTGASKLKLTTPVIKGKIVKSDGVTPVSWASISIHDRYYNYEKSDWVNTDDNGFFRSSRSLPTGTYYLDINLSSETKDLLAPDSIEVNLVAGTTNTYYYDNPIVLQPAQKTIKGYVTYPDGKKVTNAMVNAWRMDGGSGYAYTQTNSSGYYSFKVGTGNWQISINPDWSNEQPDWGYIKSPKGATFTLDNSVSESKTVDFEVSKFSAVLSGRVLLPDGSSANSNTASVNAWNPGGMGGSWGQLDNNGYFSLKLPAGTFQIEIMPFNNELYGSPNLGLITLAENQNYNLGSIKLLEKNEFITGKVVDSNNNPLASKSVNAWKSSGTGWGWAETNEKGEYTLGLTSGTWFVDVMVDSAYDPNAEDQTVYARSQPPKQVTLSEKETKSNVNFTLAIADATINGTVQDSDNNIITDLFGWVEAHDASRFSSFGEMGFSGLGGEIKNGKFTLKVPAGTYNLSVFMPWGADYSAASQTEIEVGAGETYDGAIVAVLPNNATITGSLLDKNGDPVTDVWGEVFADNGAGGNQWTQFENGTYTLRVSEGDWRLGYWVDPLSGYLSQFSGETKVAAKANKTINQNLTLLKADSTITGTVLDPDGQPLKNAWVSADTEKGGRRSSENEDFYYGPMFNQGNITDVNGHFSIKVPAGEYFVSASLPPDQGYINPKSVTVSVDQDNPVEVTLNFREADGLITGQILLASELNSGFVWGWSEEGGNSQVVSYDGNYSLNVTKGEVWHLGANYETNSKFYRSDEYLVSVPETGSIEQNLELIETDIAIPPAQTTTFDSTKAKIIVLADGTEINMPAYSLTTSGNVTVTATPKTQVPSTATAKPIALAYDLVVKDSQNQNITSFNGNVTIKLPYTEAQLEALEITEDDLIPMYYDESTGDWKTVGNVVIDKENKFVIFTVDHFTQFGIMTNKMKINEQEESEEEDEEDEEASDDLGEITGQDSDLVLKADNGSSHIEVWDNQGNLKASFFAYDESFRGDFQLVTGDLDGDGSKEIITVPLEGFAPHVRVFSSEGDFMGHFYAYDPSFRCGAEVKIKDVNGDSVADIITKPKSGGGPDIRAYQWNSETGAFELIDHFMAFQEEYRGEVTLEVADVTGNGNNNIIVVPRENGGPNVRIYEYNNSTEKFELVGWYFVYHQEFRGGVNIAAADVDGNGINDIIATPYSSGGPNVQVYTYNSETEEFGLLGWKMAYAENYRGGVEVKTVDIDSDGTYEIVTIPTIGGPDVRVFGYNENEENLEIIDWLWVYPSHYRIRYNLEISDVDRDGNREIVVAPKSGGPNVRLYEYDSASKSFGLKDWFMAYQEEFRGGVNLKVADVNGDGYSNLITSPYSAGGPNIRIYKWNEESEKMELDEWFMGYHSSYRMGVSVSTIY